MGAFDLVNVNHPETGLNPEHYGLVAPRLGVAYRLSDKTVIRTGGGVFFIPRRCSSRRVRIQTRRLLQQRRDNVAERRSNTAEYIQQSVSEGLIAPAGRNAESIRERCWAGRWARGNLQYENAGYTMQWNFTVQHQFPQSALRWDTRD